MLVGLWNSSTPFLRCPIYCQPWVPERLLWPDKWYQEQRHQLPHLFDWGCHNERNLWSLWWQFRLSLGQSSPHHCAWAWHQCLGMDRAGERLHDWFWSRLWIWFKLGRSYRRQWDLPWLWCDHQRNLFWLYWSSVQDNSLSQPNINIIRNTLELLVKFACSSELFLSSPFSEFPFRQGCKKLRVFPR